MSDLVSTCSSSEAIAPSVNRKLSKKKTKVSAFSDKGPDLLSNATDVPKWVTPDSFPSFPFQAMSARRPIVRRPRHMSEENLNVIRLVKKTSQNPTRTMSNLPKINLDNKIAQSLAERRRIAKEREASLLIRNCRIRKLNEHNLSTSLQADRSMSNLPLTELDNKMMKELSDRSRKAAYEAERCLVKNCREQKRLESEKSPRARSMTNFPKSSLDDKLSEERNKSSPDKDERYSVKKCRQRSLDRDQFQGSSTKSHSISNLSRDNLDDLISQAAAKRRQLAMDRETSPRKSSSPARSSLRPVRPSSSPSRFTSVKTSPQKSISSQNSSIAQSKSVQKMLKETRELKQQIQTNLNDSLFEGKGNNSCTKSINDEPEATFTLSSISKVNDPLTTSFTTSPVKRPVVVPLSTSSASDISKIVPLPVKPLDSFDEISRRLHAQPLKLVIDDKEDSSIVSADMINRIVNEVSVEILKEMNIVPSSPPSRSINTSYTFPSSVERAMEVHPSKLKRKASSGRDSSFRSLSSVSSDHSLHEILPSKGSISIRMLLPDDLYDRSLHISTPPLSQQDRSILDLSDLSISDSIDEIKSRLSSFSSLSSSMSVTERLNHIKNSRKSKLNTSLEINKDLESNKRRLNDIESITSDLDKEPEDDEIADDDSTDNISSIKSEVSPTHTATTSYQQLPDMAIEKSQQQDDVFGEEHIAVDMSPITTTSPVKLSPISSSDTKETSSSSMSSLKKAFENNEEDKFTADMVERCVSKISKQIIRSRWKGEDWHLMEPNTSFENQTFVFDLVKDIIEKTIRKDTEVPDNTKSLADFVRIAKKPTFPSDEKVLSQLLFSKIADLTNLGQKPNAPRSIKRDGLVGFWRKSREREFIDALISDEIWAEDKLWTQFNVHEDEVMETLNENLFEDLLADIIKEVAERVHTEN